jgi:hypothetical protein
MKNDTMPGSIFSRSHTGFFPSYHQGIEPEGLRGVRDVFLSDKYKDFLLFGCTMKTIIP